MTFPRRADQWTKADRVSESYCLPSQLSQMSVVSAKPGSSFCLSAKKCDCYFTSDTLKSTGCTIPFLREDKRSSICLLFLVIKENCTWDLNVPIEGIFAHVCFLTCLQKLEDTVWFALPCPIMLHFHFVCLRQGLLLSLEFTRLAEGPECSLCLLSPAPLCLVLQELLDAARLYVGSGTLNAGLHLTQQALLPTNCLPSPANLLHCENFRTLLT